MDKIKVVTVNYTNTYPFIQGLSRGPIADRIELIVKNPADCAHYLESGEAQVGLLPVGVLTSFSRPFKIISEFCIGCYGKVNTVAIYSQKPLKECSSVILDYQSRTSRELAKIIIEDYLHLNLDYVQGYPGFEKNIHSDQAGLIIGDRCFEMDKLNFFKLDLGEAWLQHTDMPFTFAIWISTEELESDFQELFNEALAYGITHIKDFDIPNDKKHYLTKNISYEFDESKQDSMEYFLSLFRQYA